MTSLLDAPVPPTDPTGGRTGDPLRVVHVLAPARVGGLERVVQALATGHARRGHRVTVLAILSGAREAHPFGEGLKGTGVEVREAWVSTRDYRGERSAVAEACREAGAELLHTHGYRCDVVDGGVGRRLGIPVVATTHGFVGGGWRGRLYEAIQRRALRRFDAVAAVSRPMSLALGAAGIPADRIHVLPNAWPEGEPPLPRDEARRRLGLPADGFHIGWVGRASAEKAPDVFIEALRGVQDLPWRASVIGEGPLAEPLRRSIAGTDLSGRIHWHGRVPDAGRLLRAFDLFVLSSRTEGTPIVLLEALAAGCGIVATRVGGVPEVVSEREALLVPAASPAALAEGIRASIEDARGRAVRVAAATTRLESFRLEPWLDRYERLYRSLIANSTRGRTSS